MGSIVIGNWTVLRISLVLVKLGIGLLILHRADVRTKSQYSNVPQKAYQYEQQSIFNIFAYTFIRKTIKILK